MANASKRRLLVWGGATLVGLVLLALAMAPRPVPVDSETLARGPLVVTLDHEGRTRVREPFVVSSPVSGTVRRIELEPGDRVVEGETVVATVEPGTPEPLDVRALAETSAAVQAAEARLAEARSEVDRARARSELAEADRERADRLAQEQIVSSRELQSAETEARAAREGLRIVEAASRAAAFDLETVRARLTTGAQGTDPNRGSAATIEILAPIDGVVMRRLRQSASVVPRGEPLLEIGNPSDLEVVADYLSTDAAQIAPGMTASLERWGGDASLPGRVRRIDPAGFTKISALGVEEQRVNVIVDIEAEPSAWNSLGEGFRVEVRVVVWEGADLLTVPASSLFRRDSGWAVFRIDGSRARLTAIEVGQSDGRRSQVLSGLEVGDVVVTHPPESLEDGSRVEERSPSR